MRGEIASVWPETWVAIWEPLTSIDGVPADIFCELYRSVSEAFVSAPSLEQLADIVDDKKQAMDAFKAILPADIASERRLIKFMEDAYDIIDDLAGGKVAGIYVSLVKGFIEKYSLRYQLRPPCVFCPTLSGIFSALAKDLEVSSGNDAHVAALYQEFDDALCDLRGNVTDGRIKTVIQKQINVLEALGSSCSGASAGQLGALCAQITNWPHPAVGKSLASMYGFASDYPGIRHAGNPGSMLRPIEMKDVIAISVVLAGFTPYLRDGFDSNAVFWGS